MNHITSYQENYSFNSNALFGTNKKRKLIK